MEGGGGRRWLPGAQPSSGENSSFMYADADDTESQSQTPGMRGLDC